MPPWPRRWNLPLLLALVMSACGGSGSPGGPDGGGGGGGNLLSVGGSYPTTVTLLPSGTCTDVVVQDAVTTVTHSPGATSLTVAHAGTTYAGTVDTAGNFQAGPETVEVSPARYVISIAGRFRTTGFDATVMGAPSVIPG